MKRGFLIGFILFLTLVVLTPVPVLAARPVPLNANGDISFISAGTVKPAGDSGRWVVVEREIKGSFSGPDIVGPFAMAYKANVELATQAGNLHGTLTAGEKTLNVDGKIDPLTLVEVAPGTFLPKLSISGHWNFAKGGQGEGTFTAWAIFIPSPDGHVETFVASAFSLTGKWQP